MAMDTPPFGDLSMAAGIALPGRPADPTDGESVYHNFVGPRFFETMGIPILAGRDIEPIDDERAPRRVVISERVARRYFSGDPLGRQILVGQAAATIVGIVKDVKYASLRAAAPLMIYRPSRQEANAPAHTFLIRTSSTTAEALTPMLHAEVRRAAPALPAPAVVSLDDQVAAVLVEERMLATVSSAIGVIVALLAAIGIYSTVASVVARRQREIGMRMALGASPRQVGRMVVGDAFRTAGVGLAIGVPGALFAGWAARGVLADVLFELSPTDPLILWSAAMAIVLITSLAAYVPARRAARIDPVAAIKHE
jgi:ABC-type antimicrobial peptide transport system permease subunit